MVIRRVALVLLVCLGCAQDEEVTVTITAPDGAEQVQRGTYAEVVEPALQSAIPLKLDGSIVFDTARLFEASELELRDPAGTWFAVSRVGNELVTPAVVVAWNEDFTQLTAGAVTITLEGVADPSARARVLGRLALGLLGGDSGSETKMDGGFTIIVIAIAVSYMTCITAGEAICGNTAERNCRNGVADYQMVCGAGYDVTGGFRLGFSCTFKCR